MAIGGLFQHDIKWAAGQARVEILLPGARPNQNCGTSLEQTKTAGVSSLKRIMQEAMQS